MLEERCPACDRKVKVETMSTTLVCECGHEFYSSFNRRKWKRKKYNGTVVIRSHPKDCSLQLVECYDLSLLGIGIKGLRGFRVGDSLFFELLLPGSKKVSGYAEVCWLKNGRGGLKITRMQEVEKRSLYFFLTS